MTNASSKRGWRQSSCAASAPAKPEAPATRTRAAGSSLTGARVKALAKKLGATPSQVVIAWLLKKSPVMLPIPGTGSIAHLEENFARRDWTIPTEVAARIDTLFAPEAIAGPRYAPAAQASVSTEEFA